MPEYYVNVKEVWDRVFLVDARDKDAAVRAVIDSQCESNEELKVQEIENLFEYSYTRPPETWTTEGK